MSLRIKRVSAPAEAGRSPEQPTPPLRTAGAAGLAPLEAGTVASVLNRAEPPSAGSALVSVRLSPAAQETKHGSVTKLFDQFYSHALDNKRDIWVYLPPGYDAAHAADYPIIYMHDGQNLFDPARGFCGKCWHADQALDTGIAAGQLPEAIIIGIDNHPTDRIYEMTPSRDGKERSGGNEHYLRFIVEELMPQVERWLGVRHRRETTAMLGSSLGGLTSLTAALRYPRVFGRIAALSPSTWWHDKEIVGAIAGLRQGPAPLKLWVDSGDSGQNLDARAETAELAAAIKTQGLGKAFSYRVYAGGTHDEEHWGARLLEVLRFLVGDLAPAR